MSKSATEACGHQLLHLGHHAKHNITAVFHGRNNSYALNKTDKIVHHKVHVQRLVLDNNVHHNQSRYRSNKAKNYVKGEALDHPVHDGLSQAFAGRLVFASFGSVQRIQVQPY